MEANHFIYALNYITGFTASCLTTLKNTARMTWSYAITKCSHSG